MSLLDEVLRRGESTEPGFDDETVEAWRARTAAHMTGDKPSWPGAPVDLDDAQARRRVAAFELRLREIDTRLRSEYGLPSHHNVADPMAELLLIILSRKTPERAYLAAFERLLGAVDSWADISRMNDDTLLEMVEDGGLGGKKVDAIRDMLARVLDRFEGYSLEQLEGLDDSEVRAFLSSIQEVGPKSALCVMMYAMGRAAFPVDAHVGRTLMRTGVFDLLGLDLSTMDHKQKQRYMADLAPPDLRYSLHVTCLSLGRDVCPARTPRCGECVLATTCETGLTQQLDR